MIDITEKATVSRQATATGFIHLSSQSIKAIDDNTNPKGHVLENARLSGILAAKKTPELVFMCHQIPLSSVKLTFEIKEKGIRVWATVKTTAKTGVEIEALAAVNNSLLAIFDLSKRYEKDENGQYKTAKLTNIYITEKRKET